MILALDTSTAACTAALFDGDGQLLDSRCERIGRGHSERLSPLLEELLAGRRAATILVGVGPGSFTGIRVGLATAHGLAIGWGVPLSGFSSLGLIAAGVEGDGPVAAVIDGGHGEVFVQCFDGRPRRAKDAPVNLPPAAALERIGDRPVAGPGARLLPGRQDGALADALPDAAQLFGMAPALRDLDPTPAYLRAPDARVRGAA